MRGKRGKREEREREREEIEGEGERESERERERVEGGERREVEELTSFFANHFQFSSAFRPSSRSLSLSRHFFFFFFFE